MRRFLVRFSESEASNHTPSLADFTTTTPELKFSVHNNRRAWFESADLFAAGTLMSEDKKLRTLDDLLRVVRALAYEFKTDTVFVVGSQAILASMPDAPEAARASPEIDAFPQNAKVWEVTEAKRTRDGVRPIASEHIDGLFGSESQFHRTHG
jgi:hypothetical protein